MNLIEKKDNDAHVSVSLEELLILNNSLNEVCNGIKQFEFETRMGASQSDVQSLLSSIGSIIDKVEQL